MKPMYIELHEKLSRLQWLMQRHHLKTHDGKDRRKNPVRGQGRVLAMLKIQAEMTTKDLAYLLGIRQQSLNELLTKLEKDGFVTREPSADDKRIMIVKLTEKGKNEELEAPADSIFNVLSEKEQKDLSDYLDKIIEPLENEVGENSEDFAKHMEMLREKMGDEQFDRFMRMRSGPPYRMRKRHQEPGCGQARKHSHPAEDKDPD